MLEITYRHALERFLLEDLGQEGDLTAQVLDLTGRTSLASIVARQPGVAAGLGFMAPLFALLDPHSRTLDQLVEGQRFEPGETLLTLNGTTAALLAGERTALNLLSRCCGIATTTRHLVEQLEGTGTRLLPTRKTAPGLRLFDKYSVAVGGGARHRYALHDALMLKDNHLALGGGLEAVLRQARQRAGHMLVLELECDTLAQVDEALRADLALRQEAPRWPGLQAILLDNMDLATLREAVVRIQRHPRPILSEASGGIRPEQLRAVAETGVDFVSLGSLTHSVQPIDLGLDFR